MDDNPYKSPSTAGQRAAPWSWKAIVLVIVVTAFAVALIPALQPGKEPKNELEYFRRSHERAKREVAP